MTFVIVCFIKVIVIVIAFLAIASHAQERPQVVMHVGLHKTGSSFIQTLSRKNQVELKEDGYEMPWTIVTHENIDAELKANHNQQLYRENQVNFAACFITADPLLEFTPCVPSLLEAGHEIASRQQNIFLTTEEFDNINFNITSFMNDYLITLPYDTIRLRVIAVYRRYYDFLQSAHKEVTRNIITKILASDENMNAEMFGWRERTIVDVIYGDHEDMFRSKVEAIQRFKDALHGSAVESEVIMLNYHEIKGNLAEKFFCEAMSLNATCQAVRMGQSGTESDTINPSGDIAQYFIAYHAFKRGLLSLKNSRQVRVALRSIDAYYASLKRMQNSIKMICPPQNSLDRLLEFSLDFERRYFSREHFEGPNGEAALRDDFSKQASTNLCTVDVNSVLDSLEWQNFFKKLTDDLKKNQIGLTEVM